MPKSFKEYIGVGVSGARVGGINNVHPIADLGDTPPKGRSSKGIGLNASTSANFNSAEPTTLKPMVTGSKKIQVVSKDEKKKPKETLKIVLLIKTAVYFFIIFFIITIIVRLVG